MEEEVIKTPEIQLEAPRKSYTKIVLILTVVIFLIFSGAYYLLNQINILSKPLPNNTVPVSVQNKGTITITNLKPPDFSNQQLANFKLDKNKINTDLFPQLQSLRPLFISVAFADEKKELSVYQVKRNHLTATQAIELAKEWGYAGTPKKNDIRNDYEYFLQWGDNYSQEERYLGLIDEFDIDLVWDIQKKYGSEPYSRSSLFWQRNSVLLPDSPILSKEEAGKLALDFLKSKNLLPEGNLKTIIINKDDISFGSLSDSNSSDTLVFVERSIDGLPVIDGGISVRSDSTRLEIKIKGNNVIGIMYEEPMTNIDYTKYDLLPIKTEKQAFDDLLSSKTLAGKVRFNNSNPQYAFEGEIDWTRNTIKGLAIKEVSLAYYRNENLTHESGEYYQPIYVFKATGIVSGESFIDEEQTELTFYVPAVNFESLSVSPDIQASPQPFIESSASPSAVYPNL